MPTANPSSFAFGWIPDPPDARDYTESNPAVASLIARRDKKDLRRKALPRRVDLRPICPPPAMQGNLNACSAHAAVAAVEVAQKKARGTFTPASRLFVYKASRNLLMTTGDTGAHLRTAMQALVLFGAPPEKYWPYDPASVDAEPPGFCYAMAESFRTLRYFRHDPAGVTKAGVIARIKRHLARGTPAMFGTLLFESFKAVAQSGYFPLPQADESVIGAHAMLAVGYDDRMKPRRAPGAGGGAIDGAFLVLNSWGADWGFGGFGWLPYEYVLQDIATDWWSILHESWIDLGQFTPPAT